MKGLLVHVYRGHVDCTNSGISSKHNSFILTGNGVPEIFEPGAGSPALILVERTLQGEKRLHAEPVDEPEKGNIGWMFGGNFIYTSDSRFPNPYPIKVHDRQETVSQYKTLST